MPFFVIVVEAGLRSLDTRYEEAAATLGARRLTTFRRVVAAADRARRWSPAPRSPGRGRSASSGRRSLFAGNLQGETQTMPLAIFVELQTNLGGAIALSLVLLAVSVVVLVVAPRSLVPRMSLDAGVARAASGRSRSTSPLDAQPGQTVVLLGPNGAGKTTVLRVIAGLARRSTPGRVALDGEVLDDPKTGGVGPDRAAADRVRVPGPRAVPAPHCARERRVRPQGTRGAAE